MKCIKINRSDEVMRTSDADAARRVASGEAAYVPRSAWKASGRVDSGERDAPRASSIHPPKGWLNRSNQKPGWAR